MEFRVLKFPLTDLMLNEAIDNITQINIAILIRIVMNKHTSLHTPYNYGQKLIKGL